MSKSFIGLMSLFFLTFAFFAVMVLLREPLKNITRAKEDLATSEKNSLLFAWPLTLKAGADTSSKITVFVRSTNGKPLSNKEVSLSSTIGNVTPSSVVSDKEGKAEFTLSSPISGVANVEATADNLKVLQKVSVKFE
ncbi:hypothetical protein HGA88_06835 [Candidatus Roizmanbacteria bacterium]|nr:hypothetical protein [Candidatus Roizmanbacteria bacterium]